MKNSGTRHIEARTSYNDIKGADTMSEELWLKATDNIASTCAKINDPLSDAQRTVLAGALATWLEFQKKQYSKELDRTNHFWLDKVNAISIERDDLKQREMVLVDALREAAESVQELGNYADDHFQEKWNLVGDVQKYKDIANATLSQTADQVPTESDIDMATRQT